jgi:hypothetical protein
MRYILEYHDQRFNVRIENKEKTKRFDINIISNLWLEIYKKQQI